MKIYLEIKLLSEFNCIISISIPRPMIYQFLIIGKISLILMFSIQLDDKRKCLGKEFVYAMREELRHFA